MHAPGPAASAGAADDTTFAVLGPLEARRGEQPVALGPFKQRAMLAMLLCRANRVVSVSTLSEAVWDDAPPRTAHKNLQVYIATVRRDVLGPMRGHLVHSPPGYLLRMGPDELDLLRFAKLLETARAAAGRGESPSAARALRDALGLWRGAPMPDLTVMPLIASEVTALEETRISAFEDWAELALALGDHVGMLPSIQREVESHPLRERLRSAQMLALHRSGRQAEALAAYESMRQTLSRDLGLRPSPVLERLYQGILTADPKVAAPLTPQGVVTISPPSRETGAPTLLPRDLSDFTGRGAEVREVLSALRVGRTVSGPIVVVSGLSGSGKTALAVHAAHRLRERFPDGQVFVKLRDMWGQARPLSSVQAEVLGATGYNGEIPSAEGSRTALYRSWLADRRMLLVLDDASSERAVRPLLPGAGANGVIITSWRRLSALESARHVELGGLPATEAAELLGKIIGSGRVESDPGAAERIVEACGGLPLGIRIAGARLSVQRHLELARYAEWISDDQVLVKELTYGEGDLVLPGSATTYRHEVDRSTWSAFLQLTELGSEPFTLEEGAVLLGLSTWETARIIDQLMDVAMVASADGPSPSYRIPRWLAVSARTPSH
ncbi:NB-ARC domain-containing protein [Planotetraspora sp. A-T 1434]|uniref:AfsR/SARP family transcriptional regulator n=1 Tax=Planotetraspora sp. A-T 1434 TaxID=2979219 RepID=UPI0021C01B58|nr:AfsR/SARP family transcriptional regulator [Planotetraspora sp. A-T 1434]MCT9933606.1 NB-ARC domain-containing protein [Planotetraspora sp. A-T 1434]